MPAKELPDPEYLRQRLRYEPETGKLYWRERPDMPTGWNARYAGALAFNTPHKDGYRRGRIAGTSILAHRVVWAVVHGFWPTQEIDHENGDPADNRVANLREASRADNNRNRARGRNNTSGVVGVNWCGRERRWHVQLAGRHIGYYDTFTEAVTVRKAAERLHPFHPNHGRAAPV